MFDVLFFIENNWAFGSIHNALLKEFHLRGVNAAILNGRCDYGVEEFKLLKDSSRYILTISCGVEYLIEMGIEPERIIVVAHEEEDICALYAEHSSVMNSLKNYSVVSSHLINFSKEVGIERIPKLTKNGINFDYFYRPLREGLRNVGYAGARRSTNRFCIDRKRGYLVNDALSRIHDLNFIEHEFYNFLCMPGYYSRIDSLVVSSSQEACGLPIMESAASGCLLISTNIGYVKEYGKDAAVVLPTEENQFVEELVETLNFYKSNSKAYIEKCKLIQDFARENYDWKFVVEDWINLLG